MTADKRMFTSPAGAIPSPELSAVTCTGSGSEDSSRMKRIPLGWCKPHKNTILRYTLVDDEDFEKLSARVWSFAGRYVTRKENGKTVYLHRIIMRANQDDELDHIDGNTLNNQKSNLRKCTHAENGWNRKPTRKTGTKGVYFYKANGKYRAVITKHQKKISLGYFQTKREAILAYDRAAPRFFGQYAKLNTL